MSIVTFPSEEKLAEMASKVPEYMCPDTTPLAAYVEGLIPAERCRDIRMALGGLVSYQHHDCGAVSRECAGDPVLDPIETTARGLNALYWNYDLNQNPVSWLQTYETGGLYKRHMDGSPGQNRKFTAVCLLSDENDYEGGMLRMYFHPVLFPIPRTQGTVVVFPSWLEHEVLPVTSGVRQTINMGFWGPPFK